MIVNCLYELVKHVNILSVIMSLGVAGDAMWVRIYHIAKALEENGHQVNLSHYIIKINSTKHKPILNSIEKYETEYHVRSTKICNVFSIFYKYLKDLKAGNYDIIYGNTFMGAFIPILFKKVNNTPVILDMHGLASEEYRLKEPNYNFNMFFCELLEFITIRFADKIFCVSENMVQHLHIKKGVPLEKLVYITNGVDLDFFKNIGDTKVQLLKKELGIENKFVFGYIGGEQKWQGLGNFIEAAKKVKNEDIAFIVVGGNKKPIDDNIIYISKVPQTQITHYYSICNVLVLPRPAHIATDVAAPTKFAEYIAMGKPILTTNVGDAADLVRQYKNGLIVENNSPENLKKGILEFLDIGEDTLVEMGIKSLKLAEDEFDWGKISDKIYESLKEIR